MHARIAPAQNILAVTYKQNISSREADTVTLNSMHAYSNPDGPVILTSLCDLHRQGGNKAHNVMKRS